MLNGHRVGSFRRSNFCVAEYRDGDEAGDDEYVKTEEGSEYVRVEGCGEAGKALGRGKRDTRKRDKEINARNEEKKRNGLKGS